MKQSCSNMWVCNMSQGRYLYIVILTTILAACSIVYELTMAHTISMIFGSTIVCYSLTIGFYLASMGAGAYFYGKLKQSREAGRILVVTEIALSFFGAVCPMLLTSMHTIIRIDTIYSSPTLASIVILTIIFLTVNMVGLLSGIELPALIDLGSSNTDKDSNLNIILGFDYAGSLLGSVMFPLVFLANFELIQIGLITALLNIFCAGLLMFFILHKEDRGMKMLAATIMVAIGIFTSLYKSDRIQQFFLKNYYYFESIDYTANYLNSLEPLSDIERHSSPYQKIDIVKEKHSKADLEMLSAYSSKDYSTTYETTSSRNLYINGDPQLHELWEIFYHEWIVHVPIQVYGFVPKNILILGGGDAIMLHQLLKYKEVESVTLVDIDPKIIDLAKNHEFFLKLNHRSLYDKRVRVVIDDAYRHMQNNTEKFDAVFMDYPNPVDFNLLKLYSKEFYHFVERALNPKSFISMHVPGLNHLSPPDVWGEQKILGGNTWEYFYSTFSATGFNYIQPFMTNLEDDNEEALSYVRKVHKPEKVFDEETTKKEEKIVLRSFTNKLQFGFLMIGREAPGDFEFIDYGIENYSLNERRVMLSMQTPFERHGWVNHEKVNSIVKPRSVYGLLAGIRVPR